MWPNDVLYVRAHCSLMAYRGAFAREEYKLPQVLVYYVKLNILIKQRRRPRRLAVVFVVPFLGFTAIDRI